MLQRIISFFGIFALLGIAWLLSNNKKKISFRVIIWALLLQLTFAIIILKTGPGQLVFFYARAFITKLLSFTDVGASFLFGNLYLGNSDITQQLGQSGPLQLHDGATGQFVDIGIIFAFHILPTIIFFASLMGVMYHLGVMQKVVRFMAWIMSKTMGTSGAEAPLMIKPYVPEITQSELMAVMVGAFATIAGGVCSIWRRCGTFDVCQRYVSASFINDGEDYLA